MLCAVFGGVIQNIASEPPRSRSLRAWLDIWLPMLLAMPIAAVPFLPGAADLPAPLLLCSQSAIPAAFAGLLVGFALIDRRAASPIRCIDRHHVLVLMVLGALFLLASFVGRMTDWTGHLLLTAAMFWLWTVSGDPKSAAESAPEARDRARDPVFLVDWTGPLKHPVSPLAQGLLLLSPGLLLLAILSRFVPQMVHSAALGGRWPRSLLAVALLVPAAQAAVLAGLWCRAGSAAAIRCAVSTIILILLVGVGVMCVRFIPWASLLMSIRTGDDVAYAMTDLTGLSILLPSALLLLALPVLGLTPMLNRRTLSMLGWAFMALSIISLSVGSLIIASHWPAGEPSPTIPTLESTDSTQGRGFVPDFERGTFSQDHAI